MPLIAFPTQLLITIQHWFRKVVRCVALIQLNASSGQIGTNKEKRRHQLKLTWSRERHSPCSQFCGRLSVFIATLALAARLSAIYLPNPAMEEAASLFGPADSASDLFGSIVTNGDDDLAGSSTSPPSELPLSDTREADSSLHPEYDWRSSDGAGHYNDNFQTQYEGSAPSILTDSQPMDPYVGDYLQHAASHNGEWSPPLREIGLTACVWT
jgi:hypothetical protein